MSKQIINTTFAPAAIGPYSQGVQARGFIFTSGQVPLIPGTSQLAEGGIQAQTRQALENLKAILEAGGSSLERVVKTTVFLQNMADFAAMNAIYGEYFPSNPPARSTIQVAALPLGAMVEIEAVALAE
jgi:2-iminobutanoate/2-iminopropanoate deaminase